MTDPIEIKYTPKDLRKRYRKYPKKLSDVMEVTTRFALTKIQSLVKPYPVYRSSYRRTAQLGRSLGSGVGKADIQTTKKLGQGRFEGRFGTKLDYAEHVIGEKQARHMGHWWTIKNLRDDSEPEVENVFKKAMDKLARWLEGQK